MRRREKKQSWIFAILSSLLIIAILAAGIRVAFASGKLSPQSIVEFSGIYGVITDRFDKPIYKNGEAVNYNAFGNIVGDGVKIHNSLIYRYSDELKPGPINFITGYRSLEEKPRIMRTTLLSEDTIASLAKLYKNKNGCCFAYNYETGEVYVALSLPAYNPKNENPSYINRCFDSLYIPGSTMKIVTTALAVEQGVDLSKITYDCDGKYELPDGNEIACAYAHGHVDYTSAVGKSCNGFFVKTAGELNIDEALETFKAMGFRTNTEGEGTLDTQDFMRTVSSVDITNTTSYSNAWAFAGQGKNLVNPVHMAMIAGAIVNGGKAAEPYMVKSIYNQDKDKFIYEADEAEMTELMPAYVASGVAKYWKTGVDKFYYQPDVGMSRKITYAKTGTAQISNNRSENNRLLMGVIEESKTAFYIIVESFNDDVSVYDIANKLVSLLPKQ